MKQSKNQTRLKVVAIAVAGLLTLINNIPIAYGSDRGEMLYQNHCQSCHDTDVHSREAPLADSPETLRAWVMSWAVHNDLSWGQDEIADITAYLNRRFYHFTESE